jgi:type II secretory pathway component PulK
MNGKELMNGLMIVMPKVVKSLLASLFQWEEFPSSEKRGEGRFLGKCQVTFSSRLSSERGMVLVLTLMILVLITAMVVEFSYGVYTTTSALNNWKDSQRLSFVSKSGIALAKKTIYVDIRADQLYRFPGKMEISVENILDGFTGTVIVSVEDENGKFNLNSLVNDNQSINYIAYDIFKNLLENLNLNKDIADRIVDWIDTGGEPRLRESEEGAKNAFMDSVDELLLIRGIDHVTYEKLQPYVTVYGPFNLVNININTAPIPVIMSLYGNKKDLAERIVHERELNPFENKGKFESRVGESSNNLIMTSSYFKIKVVAEENKIKRVIEAVVNVSGLSQTVKYWREM